MDWTLHWLEAEGDLGPWREPITAEIECGRQAMARHLRPSRLDILVQRLAGQVIPETGTTGMAYRNGLFSLTIDPGNPNFARSLANGDLRRTVVHEAHHCMRMAGPGYGWTLGEALVSEGLAGNFVSRIFASPPDPWERAVDDEALRRHWPDETLLSARSYDRGAWFFGTSNQYPRWLGYTLGYRIVSDWLSATPGIEGATWVDVPAHTVLADAAARRLER